MLDRYIVKQIADTEFIATWLLLIPYHASKKVVSFFWALYFIDTFSAAETRQKAFTTTLQEEIETSSQGAFSSHVYSNFTWDDLGFRDF